MGERFQQMNLNLLLSLDALLVEENVTRAAKRTGVTQSAMSRNLASLRNLLHDDLLVRVGNGMQPTPYARSIRSGLRNNLSELQRLVRTAGLFDPAVATGTLRVAAPGHMAAIVAPNLIKRVQQEAPGLCVRFEQLDAARIVDAIDDGVDVALGPLLDLGSAVEGVLLHRDPFACLVASDHSEVKGTKLDLETYLRCSHIVISPTGRGGTVVDSYLEGAARHIVAQAESFLVAPVIVARTQLVLTAPRTALESLESSLPVRVVDAPFELPPMKLAAYWHPSRTDDPRVRWILDGIRAAFRGSAESRDSGAGFQS